MGFKVNASNLALPAKEGLRAVVDDIAALRSGILTASATYDLASLGDGAGATTTVYVPGAELGDFAHASLGVSMQGISMTAYVSAPDVVSVRFQNESAGTLDLASSTLRVFVVPRRNVSKAYGADALFASATVDVASLLDAGGATSSGITVTGAALGDFAFCSHGVDLQGILTTAYVQAADTVELRFQNETAGTIDLASTTSRVVVLPKASVHKAFGGYVKQGSAVYDPASLGDAAGATATVTVSGAALGDFAFCSISLDAQDITITPYVSAPNVVSVRFQNESTGTIDLASLTIRACAVPRGRIVDLAGQVLSK